MAIYKISDILSVLNDMKKDGFEYVDVSESEADEEGEATLHVSCIISEDFTETDFVDAVKLPKDYYCSARDI